MRVKIEIINDWLGKNKSIAGTTTKKLPTGLGHALYEDLVKLLNLSLDKNKEVSINSYDYLPIKELIINKGIEDGKISLVEQKKKGHMEGDTTKD